MKKVEPMPSSDDENNFHLTFVNMCFSGFAYACLQAFGKNLMFTLPVEEVVFLRSSIGFICLLLYLLANKEKISFKNSKPLIVRGIAGFLAFWCLYYAVHTLPLAVATTLAYTMPIFTVIFAHFFLKEKITYGISMWVFVSFIGIFFVTGADRFMGGSGLPIFSLFIAVMSGALFAVCCILARASSKKFAPTLVAFYYVGIATVAMLPLSFTKFTMPTFPQWGQLFVIAILALLQQVALVNAAKYSQAGIVGTLSLMGLGFSILSGWIFFDERLFASQWIGILILMLCIVMIAVNTSNRVGAKIKI